MNEVMKYSRYSFQTAKNNRSQKEKEFFTKKLAEKCYFCGKKWVFYFTEWSDFERKRSMFLCNRKGCNTLYKFQIIDRPTYTLFYSKRLDEFRYKDKSNGTHCFLSHKSNK
jgi:hypothetical protein